MAGPGRLKELGERVGRLAIPHLPPGPRLVALSGGADSAVCAWVALEAGGTRVRAAFVHHGLPASESMARAAREVAASLDLPLRELSVRVPEGPSPEGQARSVRYRALEEAREPGEWLLVGHTADDQAETVLANLLRGAGSEGLAGIPVRRGPIVRPLLEVTRSETRELASLLGLPWRDDPANRDPDLRRNVIRRELIPLLEERFNPGIRGVLCRTARLLAADQAELEQAAGRVPLRREGAEVRLPGPLLAVLPVPVASRAIREALREIRGPHAGTAGEVDLVLAVARGDRPAASLGGDLAAAREGAWVVLVGETPAPSAATAWRLPGSVRWGGRRMEAWLEERSPVAWPLSEWTVVFDAGTVGEEVRLRPAGGGGRIGFRGGHKEIGDALAEAGVPARLRPGWPVVEAGGRILWIPGVRSAPWGWVGEGTTRYLWMSAEGGSEGAGDASGEGEREGRQDAGHRGADPGQDR